MTITWSINNLERQASNGLVTVVHWSATAVDGDYSASIVNTQQLKKGSSFVNYDTLTEETVLGWLWDGKVNKDTVEAALKSQIKAQKEPVTMTGLPWGNE